jgi:quercetin dioxygenase-like cupin family protein
MMMRHPLRLVPLVLVLLVGLVASLGSGIVRAQEATPGADELAPEGVTFTPLGFAPNATVPVPADLVVARATFAPGGGFPFDASDPEGALLIMESGTLTIRVEEEGWTISRGAALQQAMATPDAQPDMTGVLEHVAMDQEGTLQAGDVAYIPGNRTGEVRNTGQDAASALLILTDPAGAMLGMATPAATPAS